MITTFLSPLACFKVTKEIVNVFVISGSISTMPRMDNNPVKIKVSKLLSPISDVIRKKFDSILHMGIGLYIDATKSPQLTRPNAVTDSNIVRLAPAHGVMVMRTVRVTCLSKNIRAISKMCHYSSNTAVLHRKLATSLKVSVVLTF